MRTKPKILVLDIETNANIVYSFSLAPKYIQPSNIIRERSIICAAYKWHGEPGKAKSISVLDYDGGHLDDSGLVADLNALINEADFVVAHFIKFDMRFIRGRAIINNLESPARPTEICTYRLAKKYFNLNANRLDYLGKLFGFGGKMPMDWSYWERCANGDEKAIKKMAAYNRQDVDLLDKVFTHMKPHVQLPINYNLFVESSEDIACDNCGSKNHQKRGISLTKMTKKQRHQCMDCGTWFTSKYQEEVANA